MSSEHLGRLYSLPEASFTGLRRQSREDQQVKNLRENLKDVVGLVIKSYLVSDSRTGQKVKIYALELPDLEENRSFAKKFNLRSFNETPEQFAFFRFLKTPADFNYQLSETEATKLYQKLYIQTEQKVSFYRSKLKFVDLQNLPFISIDSDGVRDYQDQPVYGDYDDVLYARARKDHFEVYVGFADITPFFNLNLDDPVVRNAERFGFSLYGNRGHLPMIGEYVERQASLLENEVRFAWVVKFKVPLSGAINTAQIKIFRAKLINRRQLDFYHEPSQIIDPEIRTNLENIRIVGSIIQNRNNSDYLEKLAYLELSTYQQTNNSHAVRELMTFTRHLMGHYAATRKLPGIYRIQAFDPTPEQLAGWLEKLNSEGHLAKASDISSPHRLSRLIIAMAESRNPRLNSHGADFFAFLTGQSVYSTSPAIHGDLNFEPYLDVKGLRKLVGLANQMVFSYDFDPEHTPRPSAEIMEKICARANSAKSTLDLNNAYFSFLQNRMTAKKQ